MGNEKRLGSAKAILRAMRELGVLASKTTLWEWRKRLPPRRRPPIRTVLNGVRLEVTADPAQLRAWVAAMKAHGLFDRSAKWHSTRDSRRDLRMRLLAETSKLSKPGDRSKRPLVRGGSAR